MFSLALPLPPLPDDDTSCDELDSIPPNQELVDDDDDDAPLVLLVLLMVDVVVVVVPTPLP